MSLVAEADEMRLVVADDGVGSGDGPAREPGGAGMGTRIVRGLAAQARGSVTWEQDAEGTTCRIDIPRGAAVHD